MLDIVRVVEEVSRNVEKACAHYIPVVTAARNKAQRVTVELRHHPENRVALWPGRKRSSCSSDGSNGKLFHAFHSASVVSQKFLYEGTDCFGPFSLEGYLGQ